VMVDESLPVGAFADITIGDWRGEEQAEEAVGFFNHSFRCLYAGDSSLGAPSIVVCSDLFDPKFKRALEARSNGTDLARRDFGFETLFCPGRWPLAGLLARDGGAQWLSSGLIGRFPSLFR